MWDNNIQQIRCPQLAVRGSWLCNVIGHNSAKAWLCNVIVHNSRAMQLIINTNYNKTRVFVVLIC
jgi:hypothetical protein